MSFRYAICNETFQGWAHDRVCAFVAECGFGGIEIAPFTFAQRITDLTAKQRTEIRKQAESNGLTIIGLHWLLAKTEDLHVISPDANIRKATGQYLGDLARACRDFGGDLLVFGSPAQRMIPPGLNAAQATELALATFQFALPVLEETNVQLCLEPLSPQETNFLNTCAETAAFVDRLNHPNVCLHLDVKAMASELTPTPDLIRHFASRAGHFHANDPNRRGPGFGDTDFRPIFVALSESHYPGWVSVEVFDYSPNPETIARESLRYMKECERAIASR